MSGALFTRISSFAWPLRLAGFAAALGLVALASWQSGEGELVSSLPPYLVNLAHGPLYGLLALSFLVLLGPAAPLRCGPRAGAMLLVLAAGFLDEWHQVFEASRGSDLKDLVTDLLGAAVAVLLAGWAARAPVGPLRRLLPAGACLALLLLWAVVATEAPVVPLPFVSS